MTQAVARRIHATSAGRLTGSVGRAPGAFSPERNPATPMMTKAAVITLR